MGQNRPNCTQIRSNCTQIGSKLDQKDPLALKTQKHNGIPHRALSLPGFETLPGTHRHCCTRRPARASRSSLDSSRLAYQHVLLLQQPLHPRKEERAVELRGQRGPLREQHPVASLLSLPQPPHGLSRIIIIPNYSPLPRFPYSASHGPVSPVPPTPPPLLPRSAPRRSRSSLPPRGSA